MQAIRTKYHGATDTKSSRISAQCEAGRIYVSYDHALNIAGNHKAACDALVKKLGWDTSHYADMVGGEFDGAMYWVFDDKRLNAIDAWVQLMRKGTPPGNPWMKPEFRALVECVARSQGFYGPAGEWIDTRTGR
jgi:hypothetical protein